MNKLFTLFICIICFTSYGRNKTLTKLAEVNSCWNEQTDINADALPGWHDRSGHEWIRTHLMLVERTLRARDMRHLTPQQARLRTESLNDLHEYWQTGNFPVNDLYNYRTPIFIDRYNNFCAVGYLLKASGYEHVSRMIAARTNLAYVRQMKYKELPVWATEHGFTVDELAWIQPGYPPSYGCAAIGTGVNGSVSELMADEASGRLYVAGSFTHADGTLAVGNIAYVTKTAGVYTWYNMGDGVDGPVYAVAKLGSDIFIGGAFSNAGGVAVTNIARWDGSTWHEAGCVYGTVRDLAVFEGKLYAAGDFYGCGIVSGGSAFARWDMGMWQPVAGLTGKVNTMEVVGSSLILGGDFDYMGTPTNIIRYDETNSFQTFTTGLNNEVKDIAVMGDTAYAVCRRTHATDTTTLVVKLRGNEWVSYWSSGYDLSGFHPGRSGELSFNTLCAEGTMLNVGGSFSFSPFMGTSGANCIVLNGYDMWPITDSTVNVMTLFDGDLYFGGDFVTGNAGGWGGSVSLNGIGRRILPAGISAGPEVESSFSVYPVPAVSGAYISIVSPSVTGHYSLQDMSGREVGQGMLGSSGKIQLPQLSAGMYMLKVQHSSGITETGKILVAQ